MTDADAGRTRAGEFPNYPGAVNPLQLDDLLPDGKRFRQLKDSYTVDEEHKWSYGAHPQVSEGELARVKDMLVRNKGAFAYSMHDLPGYNGPPVEIHLVHDKPIISKPRSYSQLEEKIRDEKCEELWEAGFIELADPYNPYASCPTMPAKKMRRVSGQTSGSALITGNKTLIPRRYDIT